MITLAFYKGTIQENPKARLFDRLTCWWHRSRGRFSHSELVANGTREGGVATCFSASSRDRGVRSKRIDLATGRWVLVTIPHFEQAPAIAWFKTHHGAGYDWKGVVGFVLPWIPESWSRFYCSRALALAVKQSAMASVLPLPWPPTERISPSALYEWAIHELGAEIFELPELAP